MFGEPSEGGAERTGLIASFFPLRGDGSSISTESRDRKTQPNRALGTVTRNQHERGSNPGSNMLEGDVDGGEESRKEKGQGWRAGGGCHWDLMDDWVGARHPLPPPSCPSPVPSLCSSPCHPICRPVDWVWFPLD